MDAGRPTKGSWLRLAEGAAWTAGAALVLAYAGARLGFEAARAQGVAEFREARRAAELPQVDRSLWSPQRVLAFESTGGAVDAAKGVLHIPSLELEVPIYGDTGELSLNRGAGHIEGTAPLGAPGNVGIAAHRDGFFRKLERIELGADVVVDVGAGALRYTVSSIEIVMPTDVHVLAPTSSPSITLVTCYPFYFVGAAPQRYIVRAELVDSRSAAESGG